mmetsp:Transcript_23878/g.36291  ORF Transcript_23878/g.36291 Transcript_23878/m.36291 type:complete len:230 (-) Transcript_23878:221-910(-)|eukprot:CAMPEP_0178905578 /NCGR_PEP_ID=MMETSP0786-20121207/6355_1 /TAXON_ID=186022 /ORGANISM="Thalassionema frauenfeldii, Strain CCMP 1798" /LENGTH=229 /DNA_ID=CAMNT_0020577205 /DNA_START=1244 /DNA_END=1933 /DNA_ORIENTATION=-
MGTPDSWDGLEGVNGGKDWSLADPVEGLKDESGGVPSNIPVDQLPVVLEKCLSTCGDNFVDVLGHVQELRDKVGSRFNDLVDKSNGLALTSAGLDTKVWTKVELDKDDAVDKVYEGFTFLKAIRNTLKHRVKGLEIRRNTLTSSVDAHGTKILALDGKLDSVIKSVGDATEICKLAETTRESLALSMNLLKTHLKPLQTFYNIYHALDTSGRCVLDRVQELERMLGYAT